MGSKGSGEVKRGHACNLLQIVEPRGPGCKGCMRIADIPAWNISISASIWTQLPRGGCKSPHRPHARVVSTKAAPCSDND